MNTNLKSTGTTNKENIQTFLKRVLSEKEIPLDDLIKVENVINFTYSDLIEVIGTSTKEEKLKIKTILVKIDFINGDIKHFLKYLTTGFFKKNYRI